MNILTEVRKALVRRLETITPASGYLTNAGANVRMGWFNEVVKAHQVGAGLIVVQKGRGMPPKGGPSALRMMPGFLVIGAVQASLDDYEAAIEALELDLLRCLTPTEGVPPDWLPHGATAVAVGPPEPAPPGDGLDVATVAIPINITTFIQSID